MNKKIFNWIFFTIIILIVVAIIIRNLDWIKNIFGGKNKKCSESDTPLECIKKMGAVAFTTPTGQEGFVYGDYQFYANGRSFNNLTKLKGSYDKEKITWDNGDTTTLKEVFSKK